MVPARVRIAPCIVVFLLLAAGPLFGESAKGHVVDRQLRSENIAHNKIGSDPVRKMVIYLPPGYDEPAQHNVRYPVIYFLPTPEASYRAAFDHEAAQRLFDQAVHSAVIGKFIFVAVDMTTPLGCSWYVNSPVTGDWENFMIQDLVPYIDANFRTLPTRDARGISGEFMGGYGAIRFAMQHPDVFGSVYALGPVGTGTGLNVMYGRPNWDRLANAQSLDEIEKGGFWSNIFATVFQANLPDADKPPLFIDLYAQKVGDQFVVNSELSSRLQNSFLLDTMISQYAGNLKSLRGLKLDWERNDGNPDHVYANQAFTRKLDEFGIPHEAEEYSSVWGHGVWADDGRIFAEVLPFFGRHLVFARQ
jgi:pimeloyl-ACP methyl ester carboxylesterase